MNQIAIANTGGMRNTRTCVDWSKRYRPEKILEERGFEVKETVKETKALAKMEEEFARYPLINTITDIGYAMAKEIAKKIDYTAEEVKNFSIISVKFQDDKDFDGRIAKFLRAFVEVSKEKDFTIITKYFNKRLSLFGRTTKNITIEGDVDCIGGCMSGGRIIVKGNAGDSVGGSMLDGEIIIEGNVGEGVGKFMHKGKIIVNGNAGQYAGFSMKGGEIHLNGDYVSISEHIFGGRIYHKGELLVDKDSIWNKLLGRLFH